MEHLDVQRLKQLQVEDPFALPLSEFPSVLVLMLQGF
jgi:hypothetical protein